MGATTGTKRVVTVFLGRSRHERTMLRDHPHERPHVRLTADQVPDAHHHGRHHERPHRRSGTNAHHHERHHRRTAGLPQFASRPPARPLTSPMLAGMSDDDHAHYELLAVPAGAEEAGLRRIGRYQTYDEALRARDQAVVEQLAARVGGTRWSST
jgi:hypothetical protein